MPALLTTRARAKVNLSLHVLGRRHDGYHTLESLVAFAGVGDTLTLEPGQTLSLTVSGPFGEGLFGEGDNLILRAARALAGVAPGLGWGAFHLVKRLPVASGIGGGSADAAGALRLLARLNGLAEDAAVLGTIGATIGADVPVCIASRARMMSGTGVELGPVLALPPLFAVLVNPGVAVATSAVFGALGLTPGETCSGPAASVDVGGLAEAPRAIDQLGRSGNDLEAPAMRVAPELEDVLAMLRDNPGCRLARMSGSGATCFGLYDDCRASATAAKLLRTARPGWWVKPTVLR